MKIEEYVKKKYPQAAANVRRDAEWKKQSATSAQLAQLWKYDESLYQKGEQMTRGELSFLLDKFSREKPSKKVSKLFNVEVAPLDKESKKMTSYEWIVIKSNKEGASDTYILNIRIPDNFNYLEVVQNILGKFEAKIYRKGICLLLR
jgi:hypothetical protein